jgi:hypothetical protein
MRHILLARPDQLDRRPWHLLGNEHRLLDKVMRRGAASKATAKVHPVHVAFADRKLGCGGRDSEGGLGVLGRRPDLTSVRGPQSRRVHRLHGRMVLKGIGVDGFDFLDRGRKRRFGIALLVADVSLFGVQTFLEPCRDRFA